MLDLTFDPSLRSNDGSLALVSCLSSGYRFASVVRCVGLVFDCFEFNFVDSFLLKYVLTQAQVIKGFY